MHDLSWPVLGSKARSQFFLKANFVSSYLNWFYFYHYYFFAAIAVLFFFPLDKMRKLAARKTSDGGDGISVDKLL